MMRVTLSNNKMIIQSPTEELRSAVHEELSYTDKAKQYQIKRMSRNPWSRNSPLYKQLQQEVDGKLYEYVGNDLHIPSSFYLYFKDMLNGADILDLRKETGRKIVIPWVNKPHNLREYQEEALELMMCHAPGTLILCFDGSLKKVEDIIVGDVLMGPDSGPRRVLETHTGIGQLFEIIPKKGQPFVVNGNHILHLRRSYSSLNRSKKRNSRALTDDEYVEISVKDYLSSSKSFKHKYKLYRANLINWPERELPIDPYMLGVWLGDGASHTTEFSSKDPEIIYFLKEFAASNNLELKQKNDITFRLNSKIGTRNKLNSLMSALKSKNLVNNKHIPHIYKTSSPKQRLELLAGLLDTDGSLIDSTIFDFIQKNKSIAEDVAYIARSLGLAAYIKPSWKRATNSKKAIKELYWRVQIHGNTSIIPTKIKRKQAKVRSQIKNCLNVGFKIKPLNIGTYYGFEVDGDHLYLKDDFTVLHNCNYRGIVNLATGLGKTLIATHFIQRYKKNALVVCPSESVAKQFYDLFVESFGKHKVGFYGGGKKKISDITVGIAASITRNIEEFRNANLGVVILDETHHTPATTFYEIAHGLSSVGKIFGLTATDYRSDGKDVMITAGCGTVLIRRDIKWGVENGWLAEPYFLIREVDTGGRDYKDDKLLSYKEHVLNNTIMKSRIENDARQMMIAGKQVLILVDEVAHGKELSQNLGIPFATGEDKNSQEYVNQLNKGKVKGLVGTSGKVGEGTDTKNVDVLILADFTASKGPVIQAVGRALRKQGSKDKALILDYVPKGSTMLSRHAYNRIKYYQEITDKIKLITL